MEKEFGIIVNSDEYKSFLDRLTKLKLSKKLSKKYSEYRYMRSVCDARAYTIITAKDKNGTTWKFKIKNLTLEKFKTVDEIFKYIKKLKNQRLRRIARKIF